LEIVDVLRFVAGHPLNKHRKISALLNFIKWQLGIRLISSVVVFEWINGAKFFVRRGETGLTGNVYAGLHEYSDMAFVLHFLRKDDLFVDVGANSGSYTILACAAVGCEGYAFEPIFSTYQNLTENLRLNHLENRVTALNVGVGAAVGEIAFTTGLDTVNHAVSTSDTGAQSVMVPIVPLDEVLADRNPTMIKIDIEGYETPAIEGALRTLRESSLKAVIMELNGSGARYGFNEAKILEIMKELGFESFSYDPISRTLVSLQGKNLTSGNTLFIRDQQFVCARLESAPRVVVHDKSI